MEESKDIENIRKDLVDMKIRPELYLFTQVDKLMKLAADLTLTPQEHHQFCKCIKLVKFPNSFASNLTRNIADNYDKISSLKSCDCHVIMQYLLSWVFNHFSKSQLSQQLLSYALFLNNFVQELSTCQT